MQIKSIIFDLDGLLINSEIVSFEIYKELLAQHQHNFTLEIMHRIIQGDLAS